MFFRLIRFIVAVFALVGLWFVYSASNQARLWKISLSQLDKLPDVDYRLLAEEYWAGDNKQAALACLEYVVSNKLSDAPASEKLYEKYLGEIRRRSSPIGRLTAFGKGFLFSDIDGADALAGSVLADILVYGDVRDIVKEGFIEKDGDDFILAMAGVGLVTTLFPPADSSVSLLKLLVKTNSLSAPLKATFAKSAKTIGAAVADSSKKAEAISEIKKTVLPVAELAKNSRSWTQFSSIMKCAHSPDEIAKAAKLIGKKASNARKFEQILILSRFRAEDMFSATIKGGQFAMDKIYSALRKGPRGLALVSKHPAFTARVFKNVPKTYPLASAYAAQKIFENVLYKYAAYGIFSLIFVAAVISPAGIWRFGKSQNAGAFKILATMPFLYVAAALALFALVSLADWKISGVALSQKNSDSGGKYANINGYLGYATWNVRVKIDESNWWNETFEKSFCAPLVNDGNDAFLICDSKNLGFLWSESAKGKVYNIEVFAERRGDNPLSFIPSEVFISKDNNRFAIIKVPSKFSQELSLRPYFDKDLPPSERSLLFTSENGFAPHSPNIVFENGLYRFLTKAGTKIGDIIATTPRGLFLGMAENKPNENNADSENMVLFAPRTFDNDNFIVVLLSKKDGEKYYKSFSETSKTIQKKQ